MNDPRLPGRVRRIALVVTFGLGALDAWFFRQWNLDYDGISYYDLARAVPNQGVSAVVNGYWSPLYPLTLRAALKLFRPDADAMYPLVRGIVFLTYLGTTISFDRLVRGILSYSPGYQRQSVWVQTVAVCVPPARPQSDRPL